MTKIKLIHTTCMMWHTCYATLHCDVKHSVLCLSVRCLHGARSRAELNVQRDVKDGRWTNVVISQAAIDATIRLLDVT